MRARIPGYESFFERRRARVRRGDGERSYTFELAALHLELLVAMAAVDGDVHGMEVRSVLGFIDRASLAPEDLDRLEQLAQAALDRPPELSVLATQLSRFAGRPALARRIADDLALVAAADSRADPREETLLRFVCEALGVAVVQIRVPDGADDDLRVSRLPQHAAPNRRQALARAEAVASSMRVRSAVRSALEASYESRDTPFG